MLKSTTKISEVHIRIKKLIYQGSIQPGEKLPPERDLAKQFGVSRPTLRSGLIGLVRAGVIHSRPGCGNFVVERHEHTERHAKLLAMPGWLDDFTSKEIIEARCSMGADMAGLAAERISSHHLLELSEEVVEIFAAVDTPEIFLSHEMRFHRIVAAASGNILLAEITNAMQSVLAEKQNGSLNKTVKLKKVSKIYRQIYQNIRDRDSAAARQAMREVLLY